MAYLTADAAVGRAASSASSPQLVPEGDVEMTGASVAGSVNSKRPRVFARVPLCLAKSATHPATRMYPLDGVAPQNPECVVWSDQKAFELDAFACPSCGKYRGMADLNDRMRKRLVRRVQRVLWAAEFPCGKRAITCRTCREKAQDETPKTSVINAANRKKISGTLRMELNVTVETGEQKGQCCSAAKLLVLGHMMQQRLFERDLYDVVWRQLVRTSGREALSDDESGSETLSLQDEGVSQAVCVSSR